MEEKKIKDMTGDRQERIASKKPVKDTPAQQAPRAPKRPFVRVAIPGADMTERISKKEEPKKAEPTKTEGKKQELKKDEVSADKNRRDNSRREQGQEQGREGNREKNKNHGRNRRHDRKDRRQGDASAQQAEVKNVPQEVKAAPAPEKATEPKEGQKQEQGHGGKRRHDRGRGRKENTAVKEAAKEPKETKETKEAAKTLAKESAKGADKNRRRNGEQEKTSPRKERVTLERSAPPVSAEEEFTDEQLRADGLLFTLDEEPVSHIAPAPAESVEPEEQFEVIGIRFRGTGKTYYFSPAGITFAEGDHAIVETVRGMEYGDVLQGNRWVGANEVVQPLKPVLRKATEADTRHHLENRRLEDAAKPVFLEKVAGNKLDMQLVDVEYTFDNTKLCFYFTAEGRVDFRELVKDLASVFRTRIELRQIGVRDEARLFGGLGVCGRPFCCKSFLADFVQVSIKMAKEQNLSLASAKISGSCGRLMCCLRYEQDTYERENAAMPRVNSIVDTPKGKAVVLESNFLTKKIKVQTESDSTIRFFAPEEVVFVAPPPRKVQKEQANEAEGAENEALPTD